MMLPFAPLIRLHVPIAHTVHQGAALIANKTHLLLRLALPLALILRVMLFM